MIGIAEAAIIAIVAGVIFFGRKTVLDWAKTLADVKKTYSKELEEKGKEPAKTQKQ